MTLQIVQVINNDGPTPGNTQLDNGLTGPATVTEGNTLIGVGTCATYGGAHTSWGMTSQLGNVLNAVDGGNIAGGQGNLNTDQQTTLYMGSVTKGGADQITSKFEPGDRDWQAYNLLELKGQWTLVGKAVAAALGPLPAGSNTIRSPGIAVTEADLPCTLIAWTANISELSQNSDYTPQSGDRMTLIGNYWKFPGDNPQNLPNLNVSKQEITSVNTYEALMSSLSNQAEYFQIVAAVVKQASGGTTAPTPPTPPAPTNETVVLTPAQTANLANGGTLTLQGSTG